MNKYIIALAAVTSLCFGASAQSTHLRLDLKNSRAVSYPISDIDSITYSSAKGSGMSHLNVNIGKDSNQYPLENINVCALTNEIPVIDLVTDDGIYDVADKVNWHPGQISVTTNGYPGMEALDGMAFQLRGRGNSTLGYPKKPYRIKFDKKTALHSSLLKAKNYALIANYIDPTNMRNTVAFEIARTLDLPYTNHSIPVWVTLNGKDKGLYMLTEKIGLNSGSVYDIDEEKGILFEMDTYFDEDYKFRSDYYNMPVNVKDPDFAELQEDGVISDASEYLTLWKEDFSRIEKAMKLKSDEDLWDVLDLNTTVNFLLVYNLTGNCEIHHPKSTYLHKSELGTSAKYSFSPVWDFDWAYSYGDGGEGSGSSTGYLFKGTGLGNNFFRDIVARDDFRDAFAKAWDEFYKGGKFNEILSFIDSYSSLIEPAAESNYELWPPFNSWSSDPFADNISSLKKWLQERAEFISTADNFGFFEGTMTPPGTETPEDWNDALPSLLTNLASVSVSDPASNDGQGMLALIDDDPSTYYHSVYRDNSGHDPVYGSYADFKFIDAIAEVQFLMRPRANSGNGTPDEVVLYTSNDGSTWTKLTTISDILQVMPDGEKVGQFGSFKADAPFKYLRFSVTKMRKGSVLETSGDIYTYWNCGDLIFYGN